MSYTTWLIIILAAALLLYYFFRPPSQHEFIGLRPLEARLLDPPQAVSSESLILYPPAVLPTVSVRRRPRSIVEEPHSPETPPETPMRQVQEEQEFIDKNVGEEEEREIPLQAPLPQPFATDSPISNSAIPDQSILDPSIPPILTASTNLLNVSPEEVIISMPQASRIREMIGSHAQLLEYYNTNNLKSMIKLGEWLSKVAIETIFQRQFPLSHPYFLRSTRTHRKLELDGYCDSLKLAFEYNGHQHYIFPNAYHKRIEEYYTQVQNDRFKKIMCRRRGITLVIIPEKTRDVDGVPQDLIPEYIANLLPPEYNPYRYDLIAPTP